MVAEVTSLHRSAEKVIRTAEGRPVTKRVGAEVVKTESVTESESDESDESANENVTVIEQDHVLGLEYVVDHAQADEVGVGLEFGSSGRRLATE